MECLGYAEEPDRRAGSKARAEQQLLPLRHPMSDELRRRFLLTRHSTSPLGEVFESLVGSLTSWQAAGAVAGSMLYGLVCRLVPVRWLIHASIVTGILATLAYWGYRDAASAVHVSLGVGLIYMFGTLVQLDLAARVCRPQTAGTTFALLMSLINLSALLSQGLGGSLYETMAQHWGSPAAFQVLVGIGALFTAGCWLLLPLMRRTLFAQVEQANAESVPQIVSA